MLHRLKREDLTFVVEAFDHRNVQFVCVETGWRGFSRIRYVRSRVAHLAEGQVFIYRDGQFEPKRFARGHFKYLHFLFEQRRIERTVNELKRQYKQANKIAGETWH